MNNSNAALSYQQAAVPGTTPVGQIVALYDRILRDLTQALVALQTGSIEARVSELNHALLVIAHLQSVLDFERGGDAAKRFEQFYNVTRGLIVQANAQANANSLQKIIDIYTSLRQAWHHVETGLTPLARELPRTAPAADVDTRSPETRFSGAETTPLGWSA